MKINSYLQQNQHIKILERLVKINSSNPGGNEMDMVKAILSLYPLDEVEYTVIDHEQNRGSLVIQIEGKNPNKAVAFVGHIDTVPVEDENLWKHPPFDAIIEGDLMYGRGTSDMKGGVTAMILTSLYYIENRIKPPVNLLFCFTADEESDGIGITAIRKKGFLDSVDEIFIAEPTEEKIGIVEKGSLWLSLKAGGRAAHGSRPDLGVNAIELMYDFIGRLRDRIDTKTTNPLVGNTTLSITQIKGGIKSNIIPSNASATLDIRTIPGANHEEIIRFAEQIAQKLMADHAGLSIKVNVDNNRPPVGIDHKHEFIERLKAIYRELNLDDRSKGLYFYTDASQIIPFMNKPFVILGPGEDSMAHQRDEKISLASVKKVASIYLHYLMKNQYEETL